MFDVDTFLTECQAAGAESNPIGAIKEVLERAISKPDDIAAALPATRAEVVPLYVSDELSVLKAVWSPGMRFRPHNHLMWAAIGIYGGQEDNIFYRRSAGTIVESGGKQVGAGDVLLLGDDTIHAVENPLRSFAGGIHVYGGDLIGRPGRREWSDETLEEGPYDFERTRQYFEQQNALVADG